MDVEQEGAFQLTVIGLGNMGSALAERLLVSGHKVTVWNRSESRCAPLSELGAKVAQTPLEAVRAGNSILICVVDNDAVQSIISADGVREALGGKVVIQLTTLEPDQSKAQNEWMHRHQARYLDGGILGFPADVRQGNVKIAYSGSKEVFDESKPWLRSLGPEAIFVGEQAGMAPLATMLVYARYYGLTYTCMHTMALSAEAGIPADKFLELAGGEEAWRLLGRVMDNYVAMTGKGDYSTREATLEIDAAGYDFFVRLCREMGVDPAFHEMIETAISSAIEQGRGGQAIPAIFEVLWNSGDSLPN